ncbi:hypothetical protein TNIN_50381 [Trichonephila inaurata madagascariensis]|uniref:Uncharacterized protein n=1 Tax=Trichonephila inaurata madagascariensis TaxID=2747483 RepID=A0A8X6WWU7_9ARAC|nr:hypothetical protein TNIN_50381 [Trichonephila inaurata madagascariensis]
MPKDRLRPSPCAFHNEQRQVAKQYFKSQASSQTHANETHTYPSVPRRTVASGLNETRKNQDKWDLEVQPRYRQTARDTAEQSRDMATDYFRNKL